MAKRARNLDELRRRSEYLRRIYGGWGNLSSRVINPKTGKPISRSALQRQLETGHMPSSITKQINSLFNFEWPLRNLRTYDFDDWFMVIEELLEREAHLFDADGYETMLKWLSSELQGTKDVMLAGSSNGNFGWLDPTRVGHLKYPIEVFYAIVALSSPFNRIIAKSVTMGSISWNPDNIRITRTKIPNALSMIIDQLGELLEPDLMSGNIASFVPIGFRIR